MTEEEIKQKFKETYPDFMYGDTPLSPYFDIWCYAIEITEQENNKLLDVINNQDVKIADLEKQIEKMKCCENCRWLWLKEQNETVIACSSCKDKNMWRLKND